ncbi:unnamed protein product [Euphydryas editha]|uniref:Uncharacterized protein n=1 Tax=Euphydryas editha TaxID=104508 RepID=A0AAU9TBG6_EUPED|nr:unnamed protein product [Euphydryas editha]
MLLHLCATRGATSPVTFLPGHLFVANHGHERVEYTGAHAEAIAVSQTMPRKRKSTPTTMPQTPRLARSMTRKRKKVSESSVSRPPRRSRISNRPLKDTEIYKHLVSESDDNCSNFDDDVGDPEFVLESNHNTESE